MDSSKQSFINVEGFQITQMNTTKKQPDIAYPTFSWCEFLGNLVFVFVWRAKNRDLSLAVSSFPLSAYRYCPHSCSRWHFLAFFVRWLISLCVKFILIASGH